MRGRAAAGAGAGGAAAGGGRGHGGGLLGGAAAAKQRAAELGLTQASYVEGFAILRPYFFPKYPHARISAAACYTCLVLSKGCTMAGPAVLGLLVDKVSRGVVPLGELLVFTALRLLVSVFDESQRLLYQRVKEVAALELDARTFAHLHELSYSWHVSKSTGIVLQAMRRGSAAATDVVEMLFLRLVPTVLEMVVLVYIFAGAYGAPGASAVLFLAYITYFAATWWLTNWRQRLQAKSNLAGDDATQIASDSLTGFEVVKAFNAEAWELRRFSEASARLQLAGRQRQGSLVALNLVQSLIMRAALFGVLLVTAVDVAAGRQSIGVFVALLTWVSQLFTPLSWLGSLYTVIQVALTDTLNLAALLKEEPSVRDAPGALPLELRDRARGATVEMRGVRFSYPASRDLLEQVRERQRERVRAEEAAEAEHQSRRSAPMRALFSLVSASQSAAEGIARLAGVGAAPHAGAVRLDEEAGGGGAGAGAARAAAAGASAPGDVAVAVGAKHGANSGAGGSAGAEGGAGTGSGAGAGAGTGVVREVLRGVSFTIAPGKTTAIVGSTGSGKSTIARLLFRYYDAAAGGSVVIDGQDVRDVQQKSLRAAIGIVPQDAVLFNESIRYNILYGRPTATEEEVVAAAKSAQVWPFIESLQEGLNTKVGERGLKLSGGEKQRVAIARTLLKNPPILVLDEATSALDSITESSVQEAIRVAKQGRTVLVIAHRLSTVRDADEIIVLEAGEIVERGTHDALLASHGRYFALWSQQRSGVDGVDGAEIGSTGDPPAPLNA